MALARVKTWIAGDLLTALDLNNEFNNVLNNPISLVSPTTGVITFTTNQTFPTGQLSSAVTITSGTIANGATLFFSTTATPLLDTLAIGTSGQILTVSTAGKPSWVTAAAAATGSVLDPEANQEFYEDFYTALTTFSGVGPYEFMYPWSAFMGAGGAVQMTTASKGVVEITSQGGNVGSLTMGLTRVMGVTARPFASSDKPTFKTRIMSPSTAAGSWGIGLSNANFETSSPADAIWFYGSGSTTIIQACTRTGAANSTAPLGVTSTAFHKLAMVITTTQVDFYVDSVLTTSITTNIPTTMLGTGIGVTAVAGAGLDVDYIYVTSTR